MAAENKPRKPPSDISDPAPSLSKFLYKALVVVVVIIIVPLFPSRAPEFVNQSLFTRGWELVHLLFVGIAVCYGLFSRRNEDDLQKDGFETSVSRFLQASSSVFDDQFDGSGGESSSSSSSVQSWSSQSSRNEPLVVVAAADDGEISRGMVSRSVRTRVLGVNDKPLLLPVRSLKSTRVMDSAQVDANLKSNSNEGGDGNVVLRSPIPWRVRSGRMEIKEEADVSDEYAFRPVISRSDLQRASKSDSTGSTPKSSAPSPSTDLSNRPLGHMHLVSPELLATKAEDGSRKSFYKPSPPPAPPLPPSKHHKPESSLMYSSSGRGGSQMGMASVKKFTHVSSGEDSGTSVREEIIRRMNSRNADNALIVGKSVRTARSGESLAVHKKPQEMVTEGYWKDVMEAPKESTGSERKLSGINQRSMCNETAMEVPQGKEEKAVPEEIVTIESDCGSESEDEDKASEILSSFKRQEPEPVDQAMADFGPDVDKKADEFIAKFREQIRLQRIESIKRSTYQVTGKVT